MRLQQGSQKGWCCVFLEVQVYHGIQPCAGDCAKSWLNKRGWSNVSITQPASCGEPTLRVAPGIGQAPTTRPAARNMPSPQPASGLRARPPLMSEVCPRRARGVSEVCPRREVSTRENENEGDKTRQEGDKTKHEGDMRRGG